MGKGDQKSRKGKITAGSYGKVRPKKASVPAYVATEKPAKEEKPKVEKAVAEKKATKPKETKPKKTED